MKLAVRNASNTWFRVVAVMVCLLVWSGLAFGEANDNTRDTTVRANINESIIVEYWPIDNLDFGGLVPEVESEVAELTMKVVANASWGVQIGSDSETGGLRQTEVDGGYVLNGHTTKNALQWAPAGGAWAPLTSNGATLATDQGPTGSAGKELTFRLQFTPTYDDPPLKTGSYRIVLTYTVGLGY